jgi:folate-binding Fe-S cluster repair protein YgfZ
MGTELDNAEDALFWCTIRISGADAQAYLQGQISQDVDRANEGAWTFILQPDSKVVALGWLHRDGIDFLLDVMHSSSEEVLLRLRRFILRMDVHLDLEDCLEPQIASVHAAFDQGFPIDFSNYSLTPHSFGNSWIEKAVSFSKGCFTGQELVGRLDARQAPVPFQIVRVRAPLQNAVEAYVTMGPQSSQQGIISEFVSGDSICALAVLHRSVLNDVSMELSAGVSVIRSPN